MRSKKRYSGVLSNTLAMLISALCGFGVIFACILVFSVLMTKIDLNNSVLSVLTSAALCVGAYTGGYVAARKRRHNGLLIGVLCGLFIFLIIFLASYFFAGTAGGFSGSSKFAMTLICAAVGGIVGVNNKGIHIRFR